MKRRLQSLPATDQEPAGALDRTDQAREFVGPWFSAVTAARYIPCKSVKAWYEWRRRHGIIARANGSVAKADLDRVLRRRKAKRQMAATSLANLKRHGRQSESSADSTVTEFSSGGR